MYPYDNALQRIGRLLEDVKQEMQGIKEELRKKRENSEMNRLTFWFACILLSCWVLPVATILIKK